MGVLDEHREPDQLDDHPREACGVFGVYAPGQAVAHETYLGLYALQHRGQESCGMVVANSERLMAERAMGYVSEAFDQPTLDRLAGPSAIGHVRYSTAGEVSLRECQPFLVTCQHGQIAVCHNGNLPFAREERKKLEREGAIFSSTSDTEVVLHGVARSRAASVAEAIPEVLRHTEGAFSMLFLTPTELIAIRDPRGFRPLALGRLEDAWVIASETCAFDLIDAKYVRDIEPGEMVVINEDGLRSSRPLSAQQHSMCIFEHVYFARPDSLIFGQSVNRSRHKMGKRLAIEQPADADLVVPVPDSGVPAAIGYSSESGLPFRFGLVRNHYVGRTFIEPRQSIRSFGVRIKLNPVRDLIDGKRIPNAQSAEEQELELRHLGLRLDRALERAREGMIALLEGAGGTDDSAAFRREEQTRAAENRCGSPGVGYQLYLAADPQRHARQAASSRIPRGH
jgi:amidophosphoribosyltransferase